MKFAETELREITESTWQIVVGDTLQIGPSGTAAPAHGADDQIVASAQIVGDWRLVVLMYCPRQLARHAAAVTFETDPAVASAADIQDTLCELINIIAGNIKGLLSGTNHLWLPSIVNGSDFRMRIPGHVLLSEVLFSYEGWPLTVRVLGEDRLAAAPIN